MLFIPENLTSGAYVKALNNVTRGGAGVRLIVLDEVHLLLEWQYDFRTCLRMIYPLCHHGSCASMLATSATITDVDIDAIKQLYVPAASSALVICESICRSDLRVHLRQYVDDVHIDLALVRRIVSDELGALALVFAGRFATMAEYVDGLRLHPETAALIEQHPERFQRFLHALQSDENQALTMHDVQTGELRLVWCSQAASNGININRRVAVFVLGSLGSLHFIVQGIGRASRDGAGADVYLVANKASFATHIASLTTRLNDVQQTKKVRGDELVVNKVCLAVWRAQHAQLVALSAAFGGAAGAVRCGARLLYESFGGVPGDHYSNNGSCSCVVALSIAAVVGEEATMEAASRPQLSNPDVVRVLEALRVARDAVYEDELHPLGVHALADDALLVEIARDSVQHHRASQPVYAPGRASQAQLEERRVAASACVLLVTLQENRVGTNEYIERIVAHVNDMLLARHRPHRQLALETDDDADDPHD